MRVGIIQSSYLPWRGYFDFIASVDVFVFYDDAQYSKGSWRNRNKIKTSQGLQWISVPVVHQKLSQRICDTKIDSRIDWKHKHLAKWDENYRTAPFHEDARALLSGLEQGEDITISELNIRLTKKICEYLNIRTATIRSTEISVSGSKTDRLIDLLMQLKATTYLSGPSADDYLDKGAFKKTGIGLEYKSYDYDSYPQRWGAFEGSVTVLDLIANCGPDAVSYLRSRSPNNVVVPSALV